MQHDFLIQYTEIKNIFLFEQNKNVQTVNAMKKIIVKLSNKYFCYYNIGSYADFYNEISQIVYIAYREIKQKNKFDQSKSSLSTYTYIQARNIIFKTILHPIINISFSVDINYEYRDILLNIIKSNKFIQYKNIYSTKSSSAIGSINNFLISIRYDIKFVQTKITIKIQTKKIVITGTVNKYPKNINISKDQLENIPCSYSYAENTKNDTNLSTKTYMKITKYLISQLTPIEAFVISKRFGVFGENVLAIDEIANRFECDKSNISKIYAAAIKKLQKLLINKKCKRYIKNQLRSSF